MLFSLRLIVNICIDHRYFSVRQQLVYHRAICLLDKHIRVLFGLEFLFGLICSLYDRLFYRLFYLDIIFIFATYIIFIGWKFIFFSLFL